MSTRKEMYISNGRLDRATHYLDDTHKAATHEASGHNNNNTPEGAKRIKRPTAQVPNGRRFRTAWPVVPYLPLVFASPGRSCS